MPYGPRTSSGISPFLAYGKLHSTEVILSCAQTTGNEWKTAGVMAYQNDENYWHFALVEAPDNMGKKHFVELVEIAAIRH